MKILYSNLVRNIEKIVGKYRDDGIFVVIDGTVYDIFTDIIERLRSTGIRSVYKMVAVESAKSIDEAVSLWQWLGNEGANRQSLIVNIGGGITTDLGGFVAATFKRGCDFVNIPTTLMAMVDASIGGKTGINFAGLKNEVGVFADPKWILIDTDLIDTLPYTAKADGYAEMLKYGLISDSDLLRQTYDIDLENIDKKLLSSLIKRNIEIKQYLAKIDRYDRNERRAYVCTRFRGSGCKPKNRAYSRACCRLGNGVRAISVGNTLQVLQKRAPPTALFCKRALYCHTDWLPRLR